MGACSRRRLASTVAGRNAYQRTRGRHRPSGPSVSRATSRHLVVDRGDALGEGRPGVARERASARPRPRRRRSSRAVDGLDERVGQRRRVVGLDQPAGARRRRRSRPGRGRRPRSRAARTPSPRRAPGRTARARTGSTTTSEAARKSGSSSWSCQPARKTSLRADAARSSRSGCSPSHSPGKPPTSTSGARAAKPLARARVGLDQQRRSRLTAVKRPT